jgi:nicotinate-nucleotide adenylyltransferase
VSLARRLASPDPANPGQERIGILGGTFDPIHLGHLILAEEARIALSLACVLFVPAAQPWRKSGTQITPALDRLAMVRLAIEGNEHFFASLLEIERGGPTYTADTLEELRVTAPTAQLWFILGTDALRDLPNWKDPERIVAQARLAVAPRSDAGAEELNRLDVFPQRWRDRLDLLPMPQLEMSSSELRRRLRAGISTRYWLPSAVAEYAQAHRLYEGARPAGETGGGHGN